MSGSVIGAIILWLIVAIIVIAVVVYLVNWLYRRSSKEVSFVRTGLGGEKVVINGGAFVLPIIHETTPVNMNVVGLEVVRDKEDALITKDRMRVDMVAEFYVRVAPTREAVSIAAATLGRRTMEHTRLHELLAGKFIGALRSVGAEMTLEEMHERRGDYVTKVKGAASEALEMNGLELESVAITELDQTDLEYFNPSNRFDAEGLTLLIEEIETRRKTRNDIEQDAMVRIRARNLEAEKETLAIERESETARLEQERDIEVRRAAQRADLARERAQRETESEQAEILAREETEKARIANEETLNAARIAAEQTTRQRDIDRGRTIEAAEILAREEVEKTRIAQERAVAETRIASEEETQRLEIERQRAVEEAEIAARRETERARIAQERTLTELRIEQEEATRRREIERTRALEEAEIGALEATERARIAQELNVSADRIASERETRSLEIERSRSLEEAEIASREATERARIAQEFAVEEQRIATSKDRDVLEVEQRKAVEIAEQDRDIAVAAKRIENGSRRRAGVRRADISAERAKSTPRRVARDKAVDEAKLDRRRALEQLEVGRRQALEEAEIAADEEVERARIASDRGLDEARVSRDRDLRRLEIERDRTVESDEIDKTIALLRKQKERSETQTETEAARAVAVRAEEQVETARDAEIANRRREVELMLVERTRRSNASSRRSIASAPRSRPRPQRLVNEAENVLTDEARLSVFRRNLLDRIEGIVRESVRPMEKIDGINILHVDGLSGSGESGRNMTDEVIDSALRYRVQAPLIDSLLGDIGMQGGSLSRMGGLIREARDLDSIRRSAESKAGDTADEGKGSKA